MHYKADRIAVATVRLRHLTTSARFPPIISRKSATLMQAQPVSERGGNRVRTCSSHALSLSGGTCQTRRHRSAVAMRAAPVRASHPSAVKCPHEGFTDAAASRTARRGCAAHKGGPVGTCASQGFEVRRVLKEGDEASGGGGLVALVLGTRCCAGRGEGCQWRRTSGERRAYPLFNPVIYAVPEVLTHMQSHVSSTTPIHTFFALFHCTWAHGRAPRRACTGQPAKYHSS